jgi:hypothetical protein
MYHFMFIYLDPSKVSTTHIFGFIHFRIQTRVLANKCVWGQLEQRVDHHWVL